MLQTGQKQIKIEIDSKSTNTTNICWWFGGNRRNLIMILNNNNLFLNISLLTNLCVCTTVGIYPVRLKLRWIMDIQAFEIFRSP